MATTSRASRKRVADTEIFQVLEESTDSDVTIFSSEEDEDGNEPDSDENGQLDDNSETNEDGGTCTSGPTLQHMEEATDHQTKLGVSADWYSHVSQAYNQEEKFVYRNCGTALGNAVPMGKLLFLFPTLRKISGRAKVCALCIEKKKKAPSRKGKETTYKCKQCDLPLCCVGCFLEYHEQQNVEVQNLASRLLHA